MEKENLFQAIVELEKIDPNDEFAYEKAIHAYIKIKQLPIFIFQIPQGFNICRSRTHDTVELYNKISEISNAPRSLIKEYARCNKPFQSKFYGGENRPTALMELIEYWAETKSLGDKVYVTTGLWETKKKLSAIIVTSPDVEKRTSEFDRIHGEALDKHFISKASGEVQETMRIFYRFLTEKFRKPSKDDLLTYIITAAYCNISLSESNGRANCVFYPSVPFQGQGINIAINSDFITDENITLVGALCSEFTISENELHKPTFTETNSWTAKKIIMTKDLIEW